MTATTSTQGAAPEDPTEDDLALLEAIGARFRQAVGDGAPLFTTDADLWTLFLDNIPPELRQVYTCGACRMFVERYGGLVTLSEDGDVESALWANGPGVFAAAVDRLSKAAAKARVTGVFVSQDPVWGRPETGPWQHFSVTPPASMLHQHALLSPQQVMAEKSEDYQILQRGLTEFPLKVVQNAVRLLDSEQLYRSEKVAGPARWLMALHERLAAVKKRQQRLREVIVWRAVATAPPGFCHVRSTMVGTLLADLAAHMPFHQVRRRFSEKMHPLQYQRPTAPPSAGNIAQAEKAMQQLGAAGALARRFARLEDVQVTLWTSPAPAPPPQEGTGLFDHLKPVARRPKSVEAPPTTMTWEKFARTVLPSAETIELFVPSARGPYLALVTAADPAAPPLLQWDSIEHRNPVSWYVYNDGSKPESWNLTPETYCQVTAITPLPFLWDAGRSFDHQGAGVILILDGARDLVYTQGAGFFPEQLRSELHPVRSTLEAYAKTAVVAGKDEATACGLDLRKGSNRNHLLRVTTKTGRASYQIDRWD